MQPSGSEPAESHPFRLSELESWFSPGRFAFFLGILILATFSDVLIGSRTFVFHDFGLFGYPLASWHRQSFWNGEIPLWNPFNNCGVPFLAQWNTLVLYPFSLIYLLLPLSWSLAVFNLLHLFAAGFGMFWLIRSLSQSQLAAAIAGLAFAFNGLSLNCLMWPNNIAALGLMPWVVWGLINAAQAGGRQILVAGLLAGVQLLTGAPEFIGFTWILGLAFLFPIFLDAGRLRRSGRIIGVLALALGLAAAQLLPFCDLLLHSQRDRGFGGLSWSIPGWGLANFLVPLFYTYPLEQGVHFQYDQYWTSSYYIPIPVLVLALFSISRIRKSGIAALWIVALLCLLAALGPAGHLYPLLLKIAPAAGFLRYPAKFITPVVFVLCALGGLQLARWISDPGSFRISALSRLLLLLALLTGGILWFAFKYPLYPPPYSNWPRTFGSGVIRVLFLLGSAGALAVLLKARTERAARLAAGLLLTFVWLDTLTHAPNQNPTVARAVYEPGLKYIQPAPELARSRAMMSPEAFYSLWANAASDTFTNYLCNRLGLNCNVNLLDEIPKVDGFFSLNIKETEQIRALLYGRKYRELPALRDYLGVAQVTAPGKNFDWLARSNALPIVSIGQGLAFGDDVACVEGMISTNYNPREQLFLSGAERNFIRNTNRVSDARVLKLEAKPHRIVVNCASPQPTILSIAQSYYHCWEARVDGIPAHLGRVNYAFQFVPLEAGQHTVELRYVDRFFRWGLAISALSLLSAALLWRRWKPLAP